MRGLNQPTPPSMTKGCCSIARGFGDLRLIGILYPRFIAQQGGIANPACLNPNVSCGSDSDFGRRPDDVCFTSDCVAKLPKCLAPNFSQKDEASDNR